MAATDVHMLGASFGAWATLGLFIMLFLALVYRNVSAQYRCTSCRRRWAMRKTGEYERSGMLEGAKYERQCRHCGHRDWEWPGGGP